MPTFNSDGSQAGGPNSVQTLVSGASSGDTVTIPVGTFNWGTGVGLSGTVSNGSPVISGVSSTTGIVPGMSFNDLPGTFFFPAAGSVVSVTSNTITVSINSSGSGTGTFTFGLTLLVNKKIKILGLGGALNGTGASTTIIQNQYTGPCVQLKSGSDGHIEWAGIYLKEMVAVQFPGDGNISFVCYRDDSTPYTCLVHDNTFDSSPVVNYIFSIKRNGIIVWNNHFIGFGLNALGAISIVCSDYGPQSAPLGPGGQALGWNTPSTYGTLDTTGLNNIYIERNFFEALPTACVNTDDNARVVFRNNTVNDSDVHAHGQDTSVYGVRQYEIYNNTFHNTGANLNLNSWLFIRGATFVCWGNVMDAPPVGKGSIILTCQQVQRNAGPGACQTGYPANRQIGVAWSASSNVTYGFPVVTADGVGMVRDPCYIWNNTGAGGNSATNFIGANPGSAPFCPNNTILTPQTVFTGNMVSGSNQITGVNVTAGMMAPMGLFDPSQTFFPLHADGTGPHITAISGTTVTVSDNAIASGSSSTLQTGWITQGTDFILNVARPGYTPFQFPHPLTGAAPPSILEVSIKGSTVTTASQFVDRLIFRPLAPVRF